MKHTKPFGQSVSAISLAWALTGLGFVQPGYAQQNEANDGIPRVWIYRNVPEEGKEEDKRAESERHFKPFYFMPEAKANSISVNEQRSVEDIPYNGNGDGTCIEYVFGLNGADDFAVAAMIPGGKLGEKQPFDIINKGLVVGSGRPVFLKFLARTTEGQKVKVRFESGGLSVGKVRDGIRLPQVPNPDPTLLTDEWKVVTIDLTKKAAGLDSVASPLKVIVRSSDNPKQDEITVFVDDVRYEVGQPKK